MAIVTLGALFERARAFERKLEELYATVRDGTTDNGVRLLTYYLAKHRRHLARGLASVDEDRRTHLCSVELKVDIPFHPQDALAVFATPPEAMTGEQLLDATIAYDTELVAFYRRIVENHIPREAIEFVEALIHIEERDMVMLKKMLALRYF